MACPAKALWHGNYAHKDCTYFLKLDGRIRCVWCDQPQPAPAAAPPAEPTP